MKKDLLSIFIIAFVLLFMILFMVSPKKEFSENENRNLETFPKFSIESLFEGKYIPSLEAYITDHFILRDTFMGIKTKYQLLLNQKLINDVYIGSDEYLFQRYKTPENTEKLIKKLNEFYDKNSNVEMNLILVPSSGTINIDKIPNDVDFSKQLNTIKYVYENLKFKCIDIYDALKIGSADNEMYYRLDHHWTMYGAYCGYLEFCKQKGFVATDINNFEIKTVTDEFNGTLYSKANIYSYKPDKIDVFFKNEDLNVNYVYSNRVTKTLYEDKHLETKDKYAYFLDANHALIKITNENIKDNMKQNILIIKDSYANSFIPFLTSHYKEIHVIDLRFHPSDISTYIKENNINEVLFLYRAQEIDNDTSIYVIR